MTINITENMKITTEHPASHYGAGVLVVDWEPNKVFSPHDKFPTQSREIGEIRTLLFWGPTSCAEMVLYEIFGGYSYQEVGARNYAVEKYGEEGAKLLERWLSQNPNPKRREQLGTKTTNA